MIIAIDGPAASGKGTLGKRLAVHYGLRHLDTGLIYRAVAIHSYARAREGVTRKQHLSTSRKFTARKPTYDQPQYRPRLWWWLRWPFVSQNSKGLPEFI